MYIILFNKYSLTRTTKIVLIVSVRVYAHVEHIRGFISNKLLTRFLTYALTNFINTVISQIQ